jgi:hypothetical protein
MSFIYVVALAGFALVLLAVLLDAVWSVSRPPVWGKHMASLRLVATMERRGNSLQFVGAERRADEVPEEEIQKVA